MELTPVLTLILKAVPSDKLEDGVTVNVLFEFEAEGTDVITIQVLKSSEETRKVPERQLLI